jgi:hypothetical protein
MTSERVQIGFLGAAILAMIVLMFIMFIQAAFPYDAELHGQAKLAEKYADIRVEYYENQKNSPNQ